jgi:RsiW-degrading membrane proteinase PrsW (M82 family)
MRGIGILLLLMFISALPAALAVLWFRLSRFPMPLPRCLCVLPAGAAALFPALFLQRLLAAAPGFGGGGRWGPLFQIFGRIALTEELSRLLALFFFFLIAGDFKKTYPLRLEGDRAGGSSGADGSPGGGAAAGGAAAGRLAGLGFAIVENAAYGAADFRIALSRAFTAALLHGACGARIGSALLTAREGFRSAVFRFFSAVLIHGVYNVTIARSGVSALLGVLIALSALASSALEIRGRQ